MRNALVLVVLSAALAACAAPAGYAPTGYADAPSAVHYVDRPPMRLIEGPFVAPPVNDISEAQRREWLDAQRPRVEAAPESPAVERVYVREPAPVQYVPEYRHCDPWWWSLPISLSLGYWGGGGYHGHGHGHDHHDGHGGWGWGVGLNWAYPFCGH